MINYIFRHCKFVTSETCTCFSTIFFLVSNNACVYKNDC